MKARYLFMILFASASSAAFAQSAETGSVPDGDSEVCGLHVADAAMKRNGELMSVSMNMFFSDFSLQGDRAAIFTPVLVNDSDSLELAPVGIYSRIRYIQYLRSGSDALGGENETSYKYADRPKTLEYSQNVSYADWMNGAGLWLRRSDYGCCGSQLGGAIAPLAGYSEPEAVPEPPQYVPAYHYVRPAAETVKTRELSGRAYIDFLVNRTDIRPDYRNNRSELAKIEALIDSVRNDNDITIRNITVKGYASPEGSYESNAKLAKGRTESLKQYVMNLYDFEDDFITVDYEPEDWEGLRAFVDHSGLEHRSEILEIIDDDSVDPDKREWRIKSKYPSEYRILLDTVYPGLRHSDYTISYTIRQFTNVEDIRATMAVAPKKLSLNELYVLAQSLEEGSDEYNAVFEVAVRMHPDDETANLNAANSAMSRNDFVRAEKYLAKAGDSDAANSARGVYAALSGDYDAAASYCRSAVETIPEATGALEQITEISEQLK